MVERAAAASQATSFLSPGSEASSNARRRGEPRTGPLQDVEVTFGPGSLGFGFSSVDGCIELERVSGQARELGLKVGDRVVAVNGDHVRGLSKQEFLKHVKDAQRPFRMQLQRVDLQQSTEAGAVADTAMEAQQGGSLASTTTGAWHGSREREPDLPGGLRLRGALPILPGLRSRHGGRAAGRAAPGAGTRHDRERARPPPRPRGCGRGSSSSDPSSSTTPQRRRRRRL